MADLNLEEIRNRAKELLTKVKSNTSWHKALQDIESMTQEIETLRHSLHLIQTKAHWAGSEYTLVPIPDSDTFKSCVVGQERDRLGDWAVYSYNDNRVYHVEPATTDNAVREWRLLTEQGESCVAVPINIARAMANAVNHHRHLASLDKEPGPGIAPGKEPEWDSPEVAAVKKERTSILSGLVQVYQEQAQDEHLDPFTIGWISGWIVNRKREGL